MTRRLPRGVIMLLVIAGVIAVVSLASRLFLPRNPQQRLLDLRVELQRLRAAADSCRDAVEREQDRFDAMNARLDSLRGRIEDLEGLDPRGVPADSYPTYMEAFNRYHEGIPDWEPAVESLEAHWRACRTLVDRHNRYADSARDLAEEFDLLPRERRPTAPDGEREPGR